MGFTTHDLVYTELSPHRRLQRAATRATGEAAAVGVLRSSRWNCTAASRQARSVDGSRTCQLPQPASRPHNYCKQATHCISQGQQTAPPKRRESARVLCPLEQAPAVKDAREGARAVYTTVHNRQLATLSAEPYRGTHYLLRWTSILWRKAHRNLARLYAQKTYKTRNDPLFLRCVSTAVAFANGSCQPRRQAPQAASHDLE